MDNLAFSLLLLSFAVPYNKKFLKMGFSIIPMETGIQPRVSRDFKSL